MQIIFRILAMFPLLFLPVIAYNITILAGSEFVLVEPVFESNLISGAVWRVTVGDVLVICALLLLYLELVRAVHFSRRVIINHILSVLVCVVGLIQFLFMGFAGTSTYFVLILLAFVDFVAGLSVSFALARRNVGLEDYDKGTGR